MSRTRKTLKDFFRSQGSSQNGISINPADSNQSGKINYGDDLGKDPESGKELLDLDNFDTGIIGDYVNFIMASYNHETGAFSPTPANFYRPGPKNTKSPSTARGNRVHDQGGADGNSKVYTKSNSTLGQTLSKYSNSGYIKNLDQIVKKEGNPDNNDVLSFDVRKRENTGQTFINQNNDEVAVRETLEMLKDNNRFSPNEDAGDSPAYSKKGIYGDDLDNNDIYFYDNLGDSKSNKSIKIEKLSIIGENLLEKYTGIKKQNVDSKTDTELISTIEQSERQKISQKDLKANIQDSIPTDIKSGYQNIKNDLIQDERVQTVTMGSYSDIVYDDPNIAAILAGVRIKTIVSLVLDSIDNGSNKKTGYIEKIRNTVDLKFIETFYKYIDCIDEGLHVMFGAIDDISSIKVERFKNKKTLNDSRYFWISLSKEIINESERFVNIVENNSSKEFFNQLSKSKIVHFSNVIAYIGDLSLKTTNSFTDPLKIDEYQDTISTSISKSKDRSGKIAWRQEKAGSLYILPGNVTRAALKLGTGIRGVNPLKSALSEQLSKEVVITPAEGDFSRLSNSLVEKMENDLEASYMPFYFHDLRTNEIISFHAFLDSLSDGFNVDVVGSSGIGRIDPVQIYKGATRKIDLSFTVAATSKKDFDQMWWKINKLVTMIYPQWSKGTSVLDSVGFNKFIQPFSQIVSASPMIRLRVGDLIKSNYSDLSLARQFGIGNIDTSITGRAGVTTSIDFINKAKSIATIAQDAITLMIEAILYRHFGSPTGLGQFGLDAATAAASLVGGNIGTKISALNDTIAGKVAREGIARLSIENPSGKTKLYNKYVDPNNFTNNRTQDSHGPVDGDRIIIAATLPGFPYYSESDDKYYHVNAPMIGKIVGRTKIDDIVYFKIQIDDPDAPSYFLKKGDRRPTLIARFEDFRISLEHNLVDSLKLIQDLSLEDLFQDSKVLETIGHDSSEVNIFSLLMSENQFMSPYTRQDVGIIDGLAGSIPTGNPLTKAFNSTKGRGLAGFINNLSFQVYDENITWETDYNSRAPKLVKVSLSYTPIHDIPPGIDHSGFNRAPIYNVGDIMRNTSGDPYGGLGKRPEKRYKQENNNKVDR